jgi:uncharacterized integral membrane protein (TIGR00698 family)
MSNGWRELWKDEDWWAVWFGAIIIIGALLQIVPRVPKIGKWADNPLDAFYVIKDGVITGNLILPLVILMVALGVLTAIGIAAMRKEPAGRYLAGFCVVFILSVVAYWLANQVNIKYWGLSYALWALAIGLLISNTVGTPGWLAAGAKTEMFIKTGLVLLGAEVLFEKILSLGPPGLMVAWIVTPVVVIFMYLFGTGKLKMKNKSLVIIVASATSVCGVSAAIAAAAASRAKKEDLTLAVGMTLIFTVLMMFFMPLFIKAIGMHHILGAAWMGGTIDSTGAVVAAGSMLGPEAEKVAAVVKMIQNVLIGLLAFVIAIFWCYRVDREEQVTAGNSRPSAMEIWYRFPKFVIGFIGASLLFSFVLVPAMAGDFTRVESTYINPITRVLRGWFFCMAFMAIGLESNFKDLTARMEKGKPLILYVVGQSFNLALTLLVAFLAFLVLFPDAV